MSRGRRTGTGIEPPSGGLPSADLPSTGLPSDGVASAGPASAGRVSADGPASVFAGCVDGAAFLEKRHRPLYARMLRLKHLAPSGFLCFAYLEGAIALGILLALAELVSWWGVLVLPATVAIMVKLNDAVAGAVSRPALRAARLASVSPAGGGSYSPGSGREMPGRPGVPLDRGADDSSPRSRGAVRRTTATKRSAAADFGWVAGVDRGAGEVEPGRADSGVAGRDVRGDSGGGAAAHGTTGSDRFGGGEQEDHGGFVTGSGSPAYRDPAAGSAASGGPDDAVGFRGSAASGGPDDAAGFRGSAGAGSFIAPNSSSRHYGPGATDQAGPGGVTHPDHPAGRPAVSSSGTDDPMWSPDRALGKSFGRPAPAEVHEREPGGWAAASPAASPGDVNALNGPRPYGQWAEDLDSQEQRARQSAARRYE